MKKLSLSVAAVLLLIFVLSACGAEKNPKDVSSQAEGTTSSMTSQEKELWGNIVLENSKGSVTIDVTSDNGTSSSASKPSGTSEDTVTSESSVSSRDNTSSEKPAASNSSPSSSSSSVSSGSSFYDKYPKLNSNGEWSSWV